MVPDSGEFDGCGNRPCVWRETGSAFRTAARRQRRVRAVQAADNLVRKLKTELEATKKRVEARRVSDAEVIGEAVSLSIRSLVAPDSLVSMLSDRLTKLGKSLLLHWELDAQQGHHSHNMGEALRNVAHLFQLPPGMHKQYLLVKKDGDKARHSSVTLPAKQVHFGQQALPDKPVVPEVVKPFFSSCEHIFAQTGRTRTEWCGSTGQVAGRSCRFRPGCWALGVVTCEATCGVRARPRMHLRRNGVLLL
ncbi:unnamed protein product [Prorocentrum cordatum]|uniref:Uncharacterized protein n=1 Tax=Prorocentrum cordatum TaxID=2364126 RepID=A0ABN9QNL7_9DINO|nr:unnamed protein product [Polarella glacialis]